MSNRNLVSMTGWDNPRANAELLSRIGLQTETAEDGAAIGDALEANGYDLLSAGNHEGKYYDDENPQNSGRYDRDQAHPPG